METESQEGALRLVQRRRQGFLAARVFLVSTLINGLIVLVLFLIVFPGTRPNAPTLEVSIQNPEEEPEEIDNRTVQKMTRQVESGESSAGMMKPIVALVSPVSIAVPEFATATAGEMPGLNIGIQPGNGNGYGLGGRGYGRVRKVQMGSMAVKAARLGVVLDVSGSMTEKLPKVRRELRKQFKAASVVEVKGCSLSWDGKISFDLEQAQKSAKSKSRADTVLEAMEILIAADRVDAIFWYSDLQDTQNREGLLRLSYLLGTLEGKGRRPVRLYVRSVQVDPSDDLMKIVKRSGGEAGNDAEG
jgi:hypothetical protein